MKRISGLLLTGIALLLTGCSQQDTARDAAPEPEVGTVSVESSDAEPLSPEQIRLRSRVTFLASRFEGSIGIAIQDVATGWSTGFNGFALLPQQSVSKLWVGLAALDMADRERLELSRRVVVGFDDLTVFHQPIAKKAKLPGGFMTTLDDLLARAITESDNTANDVLLRHVGGPEAVREVLARKGIANVLFGPGERAMQSAIAGMEWRQQYAIGKTFFEARELVPHAVRERAIRRYLADPVDGASALAIAGTLARLKSGDLLSEASTQKFLQILSETKSGPNRLKGGVPPGWSIAHKTGTGQVLELMHTGYNDVGILTAPSGRSYAVAVLIGETRVPVPERMDFMHQIVAAIVEYEAGRSGGAIR